MDRSRRPALPRQRPPGALYAIGVQEGVPGLFGDPIGQGPLLGVCLVGRPTAPKLPQDGSIGDISRFVLVPGLPYGTASTVLARAIEIALARPKMTALIAYHDRTRHSGCIYKKAGFKKFGVSQHVGKGWGNRPGRKSGDLENTPKRRWRFDLVAERARRQSVELAARS